MSDRNLTDDDVAAVAEALESRLVERFYHNLGSGVWSFVWKAVVVALLGVAVIGAVKTGSLPVVAK